MIRTAPFRTAFFFVTAITCSVGADDGKEACINGYEQGQRLSMKGQLRAAREQLVACSLPTCPAVTRGDCEKWLAELDAKLPTVVVTAHDAVGHDTSDVKVIVDGEVRATQLDGRPIAVDPGQRVFVYESNGQRLEERLVIIEAEKRRRLFANFEVKEPLPPTPPPPPTPKPSPNVTPWIVGGVGVIALGSFIGFAAAGKSAEGCAPRCTQTQVDGLRRDYLVADISLVAALIAGGVAVYFAVHNAADAH